MSIFRALTVHAVFAPLVFLGACGSNDASAVNSAAQSGGAQAAGGSSPESTSTPSTGGVSATNSGQGTGGSVSPGSGGAMIGSGGTSSSTSNAASGGQIAATGGSGVVPTGGSKAASSGGATAVSTGGAKATSTGGATATGGTTATSTAAKFSFFVTSQEAMTRLSNSANGFGGDLRYGTADGLTGADKICAEIAESSMPGSGAKGWRAFLSVTQGPAGTPVNAIDRIGSGPWYDRLGRLVAANKTDLLNPRPVGANSTIANDLPNELGTPNHAASGSQVDNHDTLTGSNTAGGIGTTTRANTCNDWTSSVGSTGKPQLGHSWPRSSTNGVSWYSDHTAPGCSAGVNTGSQNGAGTCVGCSGGYGGIYCFALVP